VAVHQRPGHHGGGLLQRRRGAHAPLAIVVPDEVVAQALD